VKIGIMEIRHHSDNFSFWKKIRQKKVKSEAFPDDILRMLNADQFKGTLIQNVLFPVIEKYVLEFRCLSLMWSFHDDIKRNLKLIIEQLGSQEFDLKTVNKLAGDIFFNMYAIKFREERILYPLVQEMVPEDILNGLFPESLEIGFPYFQPEKLTETEVTKIQLEGLIDLETGNLTVEQIKLLFNHLPVDITFVDTVLGSHVENFKKDLIN